MVISGGVWVSHWFLTQHFIKLKVVAYKSYHKCFSGVKNPSPLQVYPVGIPCTVRIRFKKLLNKKEIQFKKEFMGTEMQSTVNNDSK